MAVRYAHGKIATGGLVFAYDTGDTRNSYKGEPTENLLYTDANVYNLGATTDFPIHPPVKEVVNGTAVGNLSWADHIRWYNYTIPAGTPITVSGWYMVHNTNPSIAYQNSARLIIYSSAGYGGTVADPGAWNTWKYFEVTYTTPSDTTSFRLEDAGYDYYNADDAANTVAYTCNVQVEVKEHATPFVAGTRSATEGLLDLMGNVTLDLSTNQGYDSEAQIVFDGTDDHISGILPILGNGAPHTIELIMSPSINQNTFGSRRDPFTIGNAATHQYSSLDVNPGNMNWYFYSRDTSFTNSPLMTAGNYYHMVLSYAGGASNNVNKRVWYNGVEQTLSAGSTETSLLPNNPQFSIGRDIGRTTAHFPGEIPVFKVYNRALTEAEALSNFNHYKTRFGI